MRTIRLGTDGPEIPVLGLGCMGMSEFYGTTDEARGIATIHRALDLGCTFLDTADMYGRGANEKLVGRALRDRREEAVVATKCGVCRDEDGNFTGVSGRPEYVRASCDGSLKRLGIDVIDLYYQHRIDAEVPIEDTVGAMADLVREGKVRYLGLSEAAPGTLGRAHAVHPIAALQTEYSLWSREPEDDLLGPTKELGITFVSYSPLGRGFLTGRWRRPEDLAEGDARRGFPRFRGENFAKNLGIVDAVRAVAEARGATPAQVALAWVLAKHDHVAAIPGTTRVERLEENLGAADLVLGADDVARLDAAAPPGAAAGTRYPEGGMRTVHR